MGKSCLITGAAGFIGFHLTLSLIKEGYEVIGLDNLNNYYDISLKKNRLDQINNLAESNKFSWRFIQGDLLEKSLIENIFRENNPEVIIHLAAQAGVRYSIENPSAYINSNLVGFNNILELSAKYKANHFIYASSSSVYGGNKKTPFSEKDPVDHPVSLYAATKRSNELIAHSYSHLYGIPCTGIRFFTVYGPWGRPDMAPMIFANAILNEKPIRIFNKGRMERDFTYISDVILKLTELVKIPISEKRISDTEGLNPSISWAPHRIFNIGYGEPIPLLKFIKLLENELKKESIKIYEDMQPGDVEKTYSDSKAIENFLGQRSKTSIQNGIKKFSEWYKTFYNYQ